MSEVRGLPAKRVQQIAQDVKKRNRGYSGKPLKLTEDQQDLFHRQILIVLADYQDTRSDVCPKCFEPYGLRQRDSNRDPVYREAVACPNCGMDAYAFARGEKQRLEVAQRIMMNLEACADVKI